jgi:hypothetical protein
MLTAWITLPHFSVSSVMNLPKSAGDSANMVRQILLRHHASGSAVSRSQWAIGIAELWSLRYLSAKHGELLAKD